MEQLWLIQILHRARPVKKPLGLLHWLDPLSKEIFRFHQIAIPVVYHLLLRQFLRKVIRFFVIFCVVTDKVP